MSWNTMTMNAMLVSSCFAAAHASPSTIFLLLEHKESFFSLIHCATPRLRARPLSSLPLPVSFSCSHTSLYLHCMVPVYFFPISQDKRKEYFLDVVAKEDPDILFIQETKFRPEMEAQHASLLPGYHGYFSSSTVKPGYSGVA